MALETLPGDEDIKDKMYFVTAGADGYVRWWDYETIDEAEVEEGEHFETEPMSELLVGNGVKISGMLRGNDHWIALDANGAIWKVYLRACAYDMSVEMYFGSRVVYRRFFSLDVFAALLAADIYTHAQPNPPQTYTLTPHHHRFLF